MRFLFVHQNFPGQFRHVLKALADMPEHQVVGIGEESNVQGRPLLHPRIRLLAYALHGRGSKDTHHYIREYEGHIRRGQSVARLAMQLREQGFVPDVVVAHPGWGEALFLKDIFPEARHVHYFEYFYRSHGGDVGFDPEFPAQLDDRLKVRIKNSTQLQSLVAADAGISPTEWQRSGYPAEFQDKIQVIHEGVDTRIVKPDPGAFIGLSSLRLSRADAVVTYVARNLEPYRGFHTFMRALPEILGRHPEAHVLIVGKDDVSYGLRLPEGQTYRRRYCLELQDRIDWSRVHFLGGLPYADYLRVLQISTCHVYLTYPFVLSWSMLEAMAAGCVLVASDTAPVRELVRDGENGRLVDFFDAAALAEAVADVLHKPEAYAQMRERARQSIIDGYDLQTRCLPRLLDQLQGRQT